MRVLFSFNGQTCIWRGSMASLNSWPVQKRNACIGALIHSRNKAFCHLYNIRRIVDEGDEEIESRAQNAARTISNLSDNSIPTHVMALALQGLGVNCKEDGGAQCSICLEDMSDVSTLGMFKGCGHVFHHNCMTLLVNCENRDTKDKCPYCRQLVKGPEDIFKISSTKRPRDSDMAVDSPPENKQRI